MWLLEKRLMWILSASVANVWLWMGKKYLVQSRNQSMAAASIKFRLFLLTGKKLGMKFIAPPAKWIQLRGGHLFLSTRNVWGWKSSPTACASHSSPSNPNWNIIEIWWFWTHERYHTPAAVWRQGNGGIMRLGNLIFPPSVSLWGVNEN